MNEKFSFCVNYYEVCPNCKKNGITEQIFPFRKRSRLDNDDKSNEYPHDVAYQLEDIIIDIHIEFKNLVKLRKQFKKALEKYEGRDKKDILKKYIILKPWLFPLVGQEVL